MSEMFEDDPRETPPRQSPPRRSRALLVTAVVLIVLFFGLSTFANFYTDRLWYRSGGYAEVFSTLFWTKTGLFLVFGSVMAAGGRAEHAAGLPAAPDVPPELARADRAGPVPRRRHPDPDPAPGGRLAADRALRRQLGARSVAALPAVAQRRVLRLPRHLLRQGHRLLRLRPAVAALPGRLRDGGDRGGADRRGGRALPVRRRPAAGDARPAVRGGAGPALGAARRLRAGQGRRLLAGPLRPGPPGRAADHRHDVRRPARGAAGQEHPDGHRGDLRDPVLPQRLAPDLAAAVGGPGAAGACPRCCWA